jgi:hypothetical protein
MRCDVRVVSELIGQCIVDGESFRINQDARRAWESKQLTDGAQQAGDIEAEIAARVLLAQWVELDHPLVPIKARGMARLARRPTRARLSVVRSPDGSKVKTIVTIVWRGGFCSWTDGSPSYGVLRGTGGALLKCTYTRIMGVLREQEAGR